MLTRPWHWRTSLAKRSLRPSDKTSSNRPGRRQREALDTWRFQDNFLIYAQKGTHAAQNRAKLLATFQWLLRSGFQPLRSGSIPAKQTLFLNLYWKHAQFAFSGSDEVALDVCPAALQTSCWFLIPKAPKTSVQMHIECPKTSRSDLPIPRAFAVCRSFVASSSLMFLVIFCSFFFFSFQVFSIFSGRFPGSEADLANSSRRPKKKERPFCCWSSERAPACSFKAPLTKRCANSKCHRQSFVSGLGLLSS